MKGSGIDPGNFFLASAWLLSCYGLVAGSLSAKLNKPAYFISSSRSVLASAICTLISLGFLARAFLSHDYRYAYVWQTSNNDMPDLYLLSAIWGGMDGSLLLWTAIMGVFAAIVSIRPVGLPLETKMWLVPMISLSNWFFQTVVLFLTNPFRFIPIDQIPVDGNGMNPLLQNPSMLIHPPMLYLGFTGFMVPSAFCLAALCSGHLGDAWTRVTRRWTLVAWSFLTAGIILGGNWAYIELGWGGFWAWDPVENASFMPWLTGTAFLHSVMVQQRRGMLKLWNISLAVMTYLLAVFGTFLTRSGIVQSVHAFAETDVGWVFLAYIVVLGVLATMLIGLRWNSLASESRLESYFSREAVFLFNNILLFSICFTTFWGTLFPFISEALTGQKSVVGPPFFNQVTAPMFTALLFFMGVGPLVSWRRASSAALKKTFSRSLIFGSILFFTGIFVDSTRPFAALFFGVSGFVSATLLSELYRSVRASGSLKKTIQKRHRRLGGLVVHLGVVVMAVAIATSTIYKTEKDLSLAVGESVIIGQYSLNLKGISPYTGPNYQAIRAEVQVSSDYGQKVLTTLLPERRLYSRSGETTTEVALKMSLKEDLYLAFAGVDRDSGSVERLSLKVFINPLQVWLWFGGLVTLLGALLLLIPGTSVSLANSSSVDEEDYVQHAELKRANG